jgi:para-aminobenzoate synthetase component 1
MFGVISYNVKNEIEPLTSANPLHVSVPLLHFFIPRKIIFKKKQQPAIFMYDGETEILSGFVFANELLQTERKPSFDFKPSLTKAEYLNAVDKLKQHIQYGNIYEITYCLDFFSEGILFDGRQTYWRLNRLSPAPMSCFYKAGPYELISSSPERFLKKKGERLISQPIKGTIKRNADSATDERLKRELLESPKERSENVMIADLVRNDLSRVAQRGSVKVDELFGIYSLSHVHQMISTISCRVKPELNFTDIIRATFPMGSMTGAPKISAMNLIEEHEPFNRGWFSGCAGYINPDGDFDFNVIIRSIIFNEQEKKLSFPAGSAITIGSDAEKEYEECLLKAEMMRKALEVN